MSLDIETHRIRIAEPTAEHAPRHPRPTPADTDEEPEEAFLARLTAWCGMDEDADLVGPVGRS